VRDQLPLFAPPVEAPLAGEAVRVKLVVAYDGRNFAGFAPNVGVRTVGGTLEAALERVLRHPVELAVAGRTDAGVHAGGQVVSFDARAEGLDLPRVQRALNRMLRPAIAVRAAEVAAPGFDARFSARARRYRYLVLNRPTPDPFLAATAWHVEAPLHLARMRLACDPLIGEHDFSSFCRRPKGDGEVSLVRRVLDARWTDDGDGLLRFDIEATAFCHQMVRSIVGTLVDVGRGRLRAGQVKGILAARDRGAAGEPAPPHGLSLEEVVYG
jgi:tRNA pseudouridine38-40 synthase